MVGVAEVEELEILVELMRMKKIKYLQKILGEEK